MPFNKTSKKSVSFRITMILAVWVIVSILAAGAASGEIIISDSVSPMKIEISTENDPSADGIISKTVSLRNTGDVPVNYVIYIESGSSSKTSSLFELSAAAASVEPGERFELQISASKNELEKYTAAELEDIKIKLVRNPDTQTPLGYIIPVTVRQSGETGTGTETKGGNSGKTVSVGTNASDAGTQAEGQAGEKIGNTGISNGEKIGNTGISNGENQTAGGETPYTDDGRTQKKSGKYIMIFTAFAACFILLLAGGFYAARNRKEE